MDQEGSTSVYIASVFQNRQHPPQGSQILPRDPRGIRRDPLVCTSLPCFKLGKIRYRDRLISAGSARDLAGSVIASIAPMFHNEENPPQGSPLWPHNTRTQPSSELEDSYEIAWPGVFLKDLRVWNISLCRQQRDNQPEALRPHPIILSQARDQGHTVLLIVIY